MTFDELKEKALSLPYAPGVYIMRDKTDKVIYVGKAKKLKNRVSQYFQDTASHTPKTRLMVSKIHHFDVIVAASEFEALVLEASQIKAHTPKYNILLKDDKHYPYLKIDLAQDYPRVELVRRVETSVCQQPEEEVTTEQIGRMVMDGLKELDEVAYIRFASVYRQFKDVQSFMEELQLLLDSQKKPQE